MLLKPVLDWIFKLPPAERRKSNWLAIFKDSMYDANYIYNKLFIRALFGVSLAALYILIRYYLPDQALQNLSVFYNCNKSFWMITIHLFVYHYVIFKYNVDIQNELISVTLDKRCPVARVFSKSSWTFIYIILVIMAFFAQFYPHIIHVYILKSYGLQNNDLPIVFASIYGIVIVANAAVFLELIVLVLEKRFRWPDQFWRDELAAANVKE